MQLRTAQELDGQVNNPYIRLLIESLPHERVATRYFRWKGVFRDQFDVLHVHWPEHMMRDPRPLMALIKRFVFLLFVARLRVQRKAVVRTLHNLQPHERGTRLERFVLRRLERITTLWIVLNDATPTPAPDATVTIQHGHYRDWHAEPSSPSVPGRFLSFGMVRAYKGMDDLVRAFNGLEDENYSLHICGRPDSSETTRILSTLAEADSRIEMQLFFVPDEALSAEIADAEVVVLPYREIHNSGVALLALSMNRPIIVRRSVTTEMLAAEFGESWVYLFDGDLTAEVLSHALATLRQATRENRVDMSSRDWNFLSEQLADAYERALRQVRAA